MFDGSIMVCLAAREHEPGKLMHCLRTAMEAVSVTKEGSADLFVKGCAGRVPALFAKIVDLATKDFNAMKDALVAAYQNIEGLAEFKVALEADKLDAKQTAKLCNDKCLQQCYQFLSHGAEKMMSLKKVLVSTSTAAGHPEFKDNEAFQTVCANAHTQ